MDRWSRWLRFVNSSCAARSGTFGYIPPNLHASGNSMRELADRGGFVLLNLLLRQPGSTCVNWRQPMSTAGDACDPTIAGDSIVKERWVAPSLPSRCAKLMKNAQRAAIAA